jgi:hypothetical protein
LILPLFEYKRMIGGGPMKYIEIALTKATVFLTEKEIRRLLYTDMELYEAALKRGKSINRTRQKQKREEDRWEWEGL